MDHTSGAQWPLPHEESGGAGDLSFMYHEAAAAELNSLEHYFTVNQIMESLVEELQHDPLLPSVPANNHSYNTAAANCFHAGNTLNISFAGTASAAGSARAQQETVESNPQASSGVLSFGNHHQDVDAPMSLFSTWRNSSSSGEGMRTLSFQLPEKRASASRPPSASAQDHVIAERKRRERLNQQFIALSTIIPGLKKTDKASLLGDAISYIKQLEDKVKNLEEKASEKTVESTILLKKPPTAGDATSSVNPPPPPPHNDLDDEEDEAALIFPKITASLNGNSILVRIQCEKRKGLFVKVLSEIEKHRLSVVNTSVMPFASSSLNITITAQIEEGFSMAIKDLVKDLDSALSQFL
ncbi:transcription factor bHLH18-like [Zingiber officinale]|uniref:transcription factor bHLH18-like n=1 Tax=Zingiber officinale TaxID=94328 RepID=UPI001C4D9AB8|nr:transcription factor bHLH18-like [Zingiber officinale]XP_042412389.1 transcription factor bHLH18-like [Zingiber officinale]XP_042412469.1 transcription factor bHLH18-like [Zingiber officinale]